MEPKEERRDKCESLQLKVVFKTINGYGMIEKKNMLKGFLKEP